MNNICITNKDRTKADEHGRLVIANCVSLIVVYMTSLIVVYMSLLVLVAGIVGFFTNPVAIFVIVGISAWIYNSFTDEYHRKIHGEIIIDSFTLWTLVCQYIVGIVRRGIIRTVYTLCIRKSM